MQRFKNILVVVDDAETSRPAVDVAAQLAVRNGARLTLVGLTEMTGANHLISLYDGTEVDVAGLLAEEQKTVLAELAATVEAPAVATDVLSGVGFVEIIKRILRDGHDIVFCSPRADGRRGLGGSSLVMHLLRKSPVPVWVETPRGDPSADVAVAVGPFTDEVKPLNERLIQLAGSLTAIRGGTLHLVHAWRLDGESMLRRGRIRQPAAHVDALVEAAFLEASANMKFLTGRVETYGVPYEVHIGKGLPGEIITASIAKIRPGVVVLGTLSRTGLSGMLIGNTAEQVLGVVESSVLAVKPADFVSPISPD